MSSYHEGHRALQDRFDSRRIADRLEAATYRDALDDGDRAFIAAANMFFLATADGAGQPDCSYKGGAPGFVRVVSPTELAWPDYDGNGQFRSLGNALVNPAVALLFIDWTQPARLRLHGRLRVEGDDPDVALWPGAQLVVRLAVQRVFPNCPRHVHSMTLTATSPYVPRADEEPPVPEWKLEPRFADALPTRRDGDD